jgi:hypothetical protein
VDFFVYLLLFETSLLSVHKLCLHLFDMDGDYGRDTNKLHSTLLRTWRGTTFAISLINYISSELGRKLQ